MLEHKMKESVKKRTVIFTIIALMLITALIGRLSYMMIFDSKYYSDKAILQQERSRKVKAPRGYIYDRNGIPLATNKQVCSISVIHSQIEDEEKVIDVLSTELKMERAEIAKKVVKESMIERIKTNVDAKTAAKIRGYKLSGVKIDEEYKRNYPYGTLASKVIGFTGGDNQGVVGLEVEYEKVLKGTDGEIIAKTDSRGIELENEGERLNNTVKGSNLLASIDYNIQNYITQAALKVMKEKNAKYVAIIVMDPNNGEILGMANVPEYDLNKPFFDGKYSMDELNKLWRNQCINDTYEPGSTFKIITATAALSEGVVDVNSCFNCPGFKIVADRRIRCHKISGHGSETFAEGFMNSCNPVFIEAGQRVGKEKYYDYIDMLELMKKTGVDLPGEAKGIIHKIENVKEVELATISFGQSFQITPLELLRSVCAIVNGGTLITPHFGIGICDDDGKLIEKFVYNEKKNVITNEISGKMRMLLEKVVSEGGGVKGQVEGYRIGGKTATSEKLPRGSGKYTASFVGIAPANKPEVVAMCIIDEPEGVYYGGTIAAPVISDVFDNILPYLNIEKSNKVVQEVR